MDKQKKNAGITLIALVITIIVMLILAGVSLNALVGDNGILKQAQYASFLSEMSAVEEAVQLWKVNQEGNAIPAKGIVQSPEINKSERIGGEVGYYRVWSTTQTMPSDSIMLDANTFNNKFGGELVYYPGGIEDLYYLDNKGLDLKTNKKYLIDAVNSMVYSVNGIMLNGVRCYSLEMAKAVMSGTYDMPQFAEAEVSGSQANGGKVAAGNTEPEFLEDGSPNPNYNPNGFQIIADSSNTNIYKLYNNGDLYAKGLKGYLMNSSEEEMNEIDSTVWTKFSIPNEIPGANTNNIQVIPGASTMYVIDSEGYLWAWGTNENNKLGLTKEQRIEYTGLVATKLNVDNKKVFKVFPARMQTYVITETNGKYELYACGYNAYGQLGTGVIEPTPDEFKKVDIENPEKIINITSQGGKDCYNLILMKDSNKNIVYFCGATTNGKECSTLSNLFKSTNLNNTNVTKYIEIFNGVYGDVLPYNIKNLYRGGNWNATDINILFDNGILYRLRNGGTLSEIKVDGKSLNVEQFETASTGVCIVKQINNNNVEFICNKEGSNVNICGDVNCDTNWKKINTYFPNDLEANQIKDFYVSNTNVFYLMNNGKVYASGMNSGAGIGKSTGEISNIICINNDSNLPLIESFIADRTTGDMEDGTILLKGKDGNLYGTGNTQVLFGENILQTSWKKIASNVKKFNARTTGDSLAYIDKNNDLWILGADSNYFGINKNNSESIRNFTRVKDFLQGTEMYDHIDGKIVDYALGSSSLRILTNEEDNNTIYVSGYYQSSVWYIYNFLGVNDTANHFEFTKVIDNVKFFYGKEADNFAIKKDNELYVWGLFDGNGVFSRKNLPTKVNLNSKIQIDDETIATNNSHYQKFIINKGVLYNAGYGSAANTVNGLNKNTLGNFTEYPSEMFENEHIKDLASCNLGSFIVLTEEGNLYGCGQYNTLGINNTDTSLNPNITKVYSNKKITQLVGGNGWYVAVTEDGNVFGTGDNSYGILGRWIGVDRNTPNSRYKTAFEWVECPELEI